MISAPFRKSNTEDAKYCKQSQLKNNIEQIVDAENECDYSALISLCATAITKANELADLKADENR